MKKILVIFLILSLAFAAEARKRKKRVKRAKDFTEKQLVFTSEKEDSLSPGLYYKKMLFGNGKVKISAHCLEIDLTSDKICLDVLKSKDQVSELESLIDVTQKTDGVLAAINGSFWRAGSNTPIGPTIKNGEVIELNPYKGWSSIVWDSEGRPKIDRLVPDARIVTKSGDMAVSNFNKRKDSLGIVIYNRFAGDTIPYIKQNVISEALMLMELDNMDDSTDSTEAFYDKSYYESVLKDNERSKSIENDLTKLLCRYIGVAKINEPYMIVVDSVITGKSCVPRNGCIISLGKDYPADFIPLPGETLAVSISLDKTDGEIMSGISATPRLVRQGVAKHEAYIEGSKGRRFIFDHLARSAVGYDKESSRLYLVSIEPTQGARKIKGASLSELALIMKKIGCYDAMNLDGGGSTTMVIDGRNVALPGRPDYSRKLSIGLGIINQGAQ